MCSLHIYLPWLGIDRLTETENRLTGPFFTNQNRKWTNFETKTENEEKKILKPKPKYQLTGPFLGNETEYAKNLKP